MQKKTKTLGKNISTRVDQDLYSRIELLATEKGIEFSVAVREILKEGCMFQDEFRLMRAEMKTMRETMMAFATKDDALVNANKIVACVKTLTDASTEATKREVKASTKEIVQELNSDND